MVEIATCSYQEFKPEMGVPVRISLGIPKYTIPWLDPHRSVWALTPRSTYLRASDEVYEREFLRQLSMTGVKKLTGLFEDIAEKADSEGPLVFLCFEKLGAKTHKPRKGLGQEDGEALVCHRRLFAKWWRLETGIVVPELGSHLRPPADGEFDTQDQGSLF